mgnify:CR=1 FL=1
MDVRVAEHEVKRLRAEPPSQPLGAGQHGFDAPGLLAPEGCEAGGRGTRERLCLRHGQHLADESRGGQGEIFHAQPIAERLLEPAVVDRPQRGPELPPLPLRHPGVHRVLAPDEGIDDHGGARGAGKRLPQRRGARAHGSQDVGHAAVDQRARNLQPRLEDGAEANLHEIRRAIRRLHLVHRRVEVVADRQVRHHRGLDAVVIVKASGNRRRVESRIFAHAKRPPLAAATRKSPRRATMSARPPVDRRPQKREPP